MTCPFAVVPVNLFYTHGWFPTFRTKRRLEDIVLTSVNRDKLRHLVEDFGKSRNWYVKRGLCWQKGILLHGPPGCGKTSTIVALASEYNSRIYNLSLNHPLLTDGLLRKTVGYLDQQSIVYLRVSFRVSGCECDFGQLTEVLPQDFDVWAKAHNRKLAEKPVKSAEHAAILAEVPTKMSSAFHNGPMTATPPHESSLQDEIQVQTFTKAQRPSPAESRLTLAGLLSVLDGVDEQNGLLFILTTSKMLTRFFKYD